MRLVFLPVLLVFLFQGCGHKGSLYLPASDQASVATAPAAPQPVAEEKKP
jgi:predicted small lipoprotein YifL